MIYHAASRQHSVTRALRYHREGQKVEVFEPNIPALLIFAAAWAVFCVGALHVAGMLPLSGAPDAVRSFGGVALVSVNVALLAGLLILTLAHSYAQLRWTSAVVVGGAIFLFAPFVVQDLPEKLKDGKAGLALLLILLIGALALLLLGGSMSGLGALSV